MKRKSILLVVIVTLLLMATYQVSIMMPIISGFGAKALCSCAYISNRSPKSILENELGNFPISIGTFELHPEDSSATGTVFGLFKATAIFREGLGCTLVRERSVEQLKSELPALHTQKPILSDTVFWPYGTRTADTLPTGVDRSMLDLAVSGAFSEPGETPVRKTRSVVVIYKGQLVAEQYADGFDKNTPQLGWSMTKSITSALYGIMSGEGIIDINKPAPVALWQSPGDPRQHITTNDLLQMSSGLYWEEVYSKASLATEMLYKRADMGMVQAVQSPEHKPGDFWYYSSGTTNLLSRNMRQLLGDNEYYTYPYKKLFSRIGVRSAIIEPDASGTFVGSSYMWATPRDWARLGLLYLQNGVWNGQRILPEGWVDYSRTPVKGSVRREYGAHFWLNAGEEGNEQNRRLPHAPTDIFSMNGYEGQRVFIIPSYDLVVVRTGQNKRGDFDFDQWLADLLKAFEKSN